MQVGTRRCSTETYVRDGSWAYRKHMEETVVDSLRPQEGVIVSGWLYVFKEGIHITNLENMQRFRNKFITVAKRLDEEDRVRAAIAFVSQELPKDAIARFHTLDSIIADGKGLCLERSLLTASILNSEQFNPKGAFGVVHGTVASKARLKIFEAHAWVEGPISGVNHIIDPSLRNFYVPEELQGGHALVRQERPKQDLHYWRAKMLIRTARRE